MPNLPTNNHLKLHVEANKDAELAIDLPCWDDLRASLEGVTGRKLNLVRRHELSDKASAFTELPGLFGEEPGYLVDQAAADSLKPAGEKELQRTLVESIGGILRELQATRAELGLRETELATAIPVIGRLDDVSDFNFRMESILRGTVEGLDGNAAALYLLDEDTTQLKLRLHWGLANSPYLEPARPLRFAVADLEALTGHAVVLEDTTLFEHWNVPESFGSAVCVPVSSPDALLGTLWLFSDDVRDYSDRETQMLEIVAGRLASELERRILIRDAVAAKAIRNRGEALVHWHIERSRLAAPVLEGWQVAGTLINSEQPRGDFHSWRLGDKDQLTLSSAAVAGSIDKSMLSSGLLHGAVRMSMLRPYSPKVALADVNEVLWSSAPENEGVSMFYGQLELNSGQLNFATAGTADAYILRPHGWEPIAGQSPPLGTDATWCADIDSQEIHPGDVLVVMSDRDLSLDHERPSFCTTALAEALLRHIHLSADELAALATDLIHERFDTPSARSLMIVKRSEAV